MSPEFRTTIDINTSPQRVWTVISDVERWQEWTASVRSITRLDQGPLVIGSRVRVHQPKLLPAVFTVTVLEEGRGFTWETRSPGLIATGDHWIDDLGGRSRVTLSLRYGGLLGPVVGNFMRGLTRRYIAMEAEGLKSRSEAS